MLDDTSVVNHLTYDAYGNITSETDTAVDHIFGYTGRERDEESDWYFYRGRPYDPLTGRFPAEDPSGRNERSKLDLGPSRWHGCHA
jgi:RHS repeat-associated protein